MKPGTPLRVGQVVMLNPDPNVCTNPMFAGCLLVVSENKSFGAMGYVQAMGKSGKPGGQAWYRPRWEEMEVLEDSLAPWVAFKQIADKQLKQ